MTVLGIYVLGLQFSYEELEYKKNIQCYYN